ncbi:hypothetical protein V2J09_021829 [Rumex salicifolius]
MQNSLTTPRDAHAKLKILQIIIQDEEATLETSLLHTVPTAIGRIPPPCLTKGVNGALAINSPSPLGHFPLRNRSSISQNISKMLSSKPVATTRNSFREVVDPTQHHIFMNRRSNPAK